MDRTAEEYLYNLTGPPAKELGYLARSIVDVSAQPLCLCLRSLHFTTFLEFPFFLHSLLLSVVMIQLLTASHSSISRLLVSSLFLSIYSCTRLPCLCLSFILSTSSKAPMLEGVSPSLYYYLLPGLLVPTTPFLLRLARSSSSSPTQWLRLPPPTIPSSSSAPATQACRWPTTCSSAPRPTSLISVSFLLPPTMPSSGTPPPHAASCPLTTPRAAPAPRARPASATASCSTSSHRLLPSIMSAVPSALSSSSAAPPASTQTARPST